MGTTPKLNFKAAIPQFEIGDDIVKNFDTPINIYIDCRQINIDHDYEYVFDTIGWPIPNRNVDWRTVKMTVNGESFYEGQSFERTDDGLLTWTDRNFKLQKNDIVFIEYTVDGNSFDAYSLEELEGMLYVIVHNYPVVVEHEHERYPLIIEIGKDGDILYYIMKDSHKVYFKINKNGTLEEVNNI